MQNSQKLNVRRLYQENQIKTAIKLCTDSFFFLNKIWKIYPIVQKQVQFGVKSGYCYGTFLGDIMICSMVFVQLFTYLDGTDKDEDVKSSKIYTFQNKYRKILFQPFLKTHKKDDCVILNFSGVLLQYSSNRYAAWSWIYGFKLMQQLGYHFVYAEVYNQNLWQIQKFYRNFGQVANQIQIKQQFALGDIYVLWRSDLSKKLELPSPQQFKKKTPKSKL